MLVVWGNGGPNTGASPLSQLPVETPAVGAREEGGEGNGLESGPLPAGIDI